MALLLVLMGEVSASAATNTAASCSQADVQSAVTAAARGDTVLVPAGSCAWGSTVTLTKGIYLIGAGSNQTIISRSGTMVTVSPDATAIANEEIIWIEGFEFDGNGSAAGMMTLNGAGANDSKPFKNLVVYKCHFENSGTSSGSLAATLQVRGQVRGVISSCGFNRVNVIATVMGNDDTDDWENTAFNQLAYGTRDNLYFETCRFGANSTWNPSDPGWIESGQGGRIAVRYCTWDMANVTGGGTELWDIHGFQNWDGSPNSGQTGTMIVEYYGNTITNAGFFRWINHRGSWGLFFNNVGFGSMGAVDLYGVTSPGRCTEDISPDPTGVYIPEVNNTYFWNNTDDGVVQTASINQPSCGVAENTDFWNYDSTFDGTTGVGRGTSAPGGTVTTGVGYWQASTATPTTDPEVIQNGTFWKATAPNTWTAYYQPFTYPHPLLAEEEGGGSGATAVCIAGAGRVRGRR